MTKILEFKQVKTVVGTAFRDCLDNLPWSFEEAVARILTASGQPIFDQVDCCKASFQATGVFKGKVFTLYDYKGDRRIHIGGRASLKAQELKDILRQALVSANPAPYEARICYGQGGTYRWPTESPAAKQEAQPEKPSVKLVGTDGNIFAVVGRCARVLREAGQADQAKEMTESVSKARSYDEALGICMRYVDAY